jgi:hypothetical protein
MSKNKIPNLFIVGAPKAGTTFLYHKLKENPSLFFTRIKELNHFSHDEIVDSNSYYQDFKIKSSDKYFKFYENSTAEKFLVDTSVSYFAYPNTAQKIYNFNPNAKIVIILRNPIKRAFSHYLMDLRMEYAELSFMEYISNPTKYSSHFHQYVKNSCYFENCAKYINQFKAPNVCILILEEIEKDLPKLFNFLDLDYSDVNIDTSEKLNANKKPRNFISRILQKNRNLTSKIKLILPYNFTKKFKKFLYKDAEKIEMSLAEYEYAENLFKEEVKNLSILIDRDLSSLWKINKK